MHPGNRSGFHDPYGPFTRDRQITGLRTDAPVTPVNAPHPGLARQMRAPGTWASNESLEPSRCKRRWSGEVMVTRTKPSPGLQPPAEPIQTPRPPLPSTPFDMLVRQRNQLMAEAHALTEIPPSSVDLKTLDASLTTLRRLTERLASLDNDIHQVLGAHEPEMQTAIRNVLRLSMSDLVESIRQQAIALLERRLSGLGVRFLSDLPGKLETYIGITPLPVELLVELATLHAADASPASQIIAARLLTDAARHTPLPLEPATWLSLKTGLELLAGSLLGRLTDEDRRALLGTEDLGHCLGHVQLQHALLNPDHTSEDCLQQVLLMPGSRSIVMIRLLALPAPWTAAACQLAAACASAVETSAGFMLASTDDAHARLKMRLDQEGAARDQPDLSPADMTAADGLFHMFPVFRQVHQARDAEQRWALEMQQRMT